MLAQIFDLMKLSIVSPKEGAATILSFSPGRETLWSVLALIAVVSGILSTVSSYFIPVDTTEELGQNLMASPFLFTLILAGILLITVICTHYIGKGFGGSGEFNESLLVVAWLQSILVVVQVVQLVVIVISPGIAQMLGMASVLLFLWLYVNFVAVLHGFKSVPLVMAGMIVSMFAVGFGLSILLGIVAAFLGLEITGV